MPGIFSFWPGNRVSGEPFEDVVQELKYVSGVELVRLARHERTGVGACERDSKLT